MNPYRESDKPKSRRLREYFVDRKRWLNITPLTVVLAAVLLAGIAIAATPALRVNAVDMPDGTGTALSATGHGVIKYDNASHAFQASTNGGAFAAFGGGGGASLSTANTWTASQNVASVALTDGASIATNAALGNTFTVTIAGNRTLANPTNLVAGGLYQWIITQDATGDRTRAYGALFTWPNQGGAPTLQVAAAAQDVISCAYDGSHLLCFYGGSGVPPYEYSLVDAALSLGALSTASNTTTGQLIQFKHALHVTGIRFYWVGGFGALNVTCTLWDSTNTSVGSATVAVNTAGDYFAMFAPVAVGASSLYKTYTIGCWDNTGVGGHYTYMSTAPYRPANQTDNVPYSKSAWVQVMDDAEYSAGNARPATSIGGTTQYFPVDPVIAP